MARLTVGESVGTGPIRIMRTRPTDGPDQPGGDPDVGDLLVSRAGTCYLVVAAKPTRGHPPEARRWTLTVHTTTDPQSDARVFTLG